MNAIDVSAGLVFRAGKLLITQRKKGDHLEGLWEFPGGKREPNETFAECLRRELREELEIEVEVGAEVEEITHAYPGKTVRLKFFACALLKGEPQPLGCADLRWVACEELGGYEFPAADARLIRRLLETRALWDSAG